LSGENSPALIPRRCDGGIVLAVRLTPKSAHDEVKGVESFDGASVLVARVRALPEAGRANQALEKLIAKWLGVPPSTVSVAHGGKSRLKQVKVEGDADKLSRLVAEKLCEL
jgi:uncharacterized protein YggU (UPF0235/DUF167 family)